MGKGKKGGAVRSGGGGASEFFTTDVDPRRVRYAHSKIKPVFSGCGRTIEQTLSEIRNGETKPSDLPMITVLVGPADPRDGETCFFSLNNRRLFVFKACREEGLLGRNGWIRVRARAMKPHERERYTLDRCSLQAKFLFAPKPSASSNPSNGVASSDASGTAGKPDQEKATPGGTTRRGGLQGEPSASAGILLHEGEDDVGAFRSSPQRDAMDCSGQSRARKGPVKV
ncbi:unnamed protein product [Ascophyllum nodosum]